MKKKILIYSFILFFILISITLGVVFAVNNKDSEDKDIDEKLKQEINLLEDRIISMMNKLNNINFSNAILKEESAQNEKKNSNEQSSSPNTNEESGKNSSSSSNSSKSNSEDNERTPSNDNIKYEVTKKGILINENDEVDWKFMKINFEAIYTIWPTIIIDLNSIGIEKDEILNFSMQLDQITLSIKNEDKVATLNNLASLYSFLPIYRNKISNDLNEVNIYFCKNCILNAYAFLEQNNWQEIQNQLKNATNFYVTVMDSVNTNVDNQNHINKAYILLNELSNCVDLQDRDIFLIKYRNIMEELADILQ